MAASMQIKPMRSGEEDNTDAAQQRGSQTVKPVPDAALDAMRDTLKENGAPTNGGTTYMQARTANEVLQSANQPRAAARTQGRVNR